MCFLSQNEAFEAEANIESRNQHFIRNFQIEENYLTIDHQVSRNNDQKAKTIFKKLGGFEKIFIRRKKKKLKEKLETSPQFYIHLKKDIPDLPKSNRNTF